MEPMKQHAVFHITFGTILSTVLIFSLVYWGLPYGLEYFGYPPDLLLDEKMRMYFGVLWAGVHFFRSGLRHSRLGFFLRFLRSCLLITALALSGWYLYEYVLPDHSLDQLQTVFHRARSYIPDLPDQQPDLTGYTWREERNGLPLVGVKADLSEPEIQAMVQECVYSLPDWLLQQTNAIHILDDASFSAAMAAHSIQSPGLVAGFSSYSYTDDGSGLLASNHDEEVFLRLSSLDAATTAHELTHCFDFEHDITQKNADSDYTETVRSLYAANPLAISAYGATDVSEFFAEAGSLYIMDPQALNQRSPELYSIFQSLYGTQTKDQPLFGFG